MGLMILGMGTAVPPFRISQADAAQVARLFAGPTDGQERTLAALYRRTGVETRHSTILQTESGPAGERQTFFPGAASAQDRGPSTAERMQQFDAAAAPLAIEAAQRALNESGVAAAEITHLVTVSCSGFSAPGFDYALIGELGLRRGVARTHVGFMGCHGALNGLRVARAFAESDPAARILVCAVELCSLHYRYGWDPESLVANALFSDGAAAIVGSARTPANRPAIFELQSNGSHCVEETIDAMTWRVGNHGFEMTLSARVPDLIVEHLRPWLERWLNDHKLTLGEIGSWAVHPGGPRILGACLEAIGLNKAALTASQQILSEFGNMSSPTLLFILNRLRMTAAPLPCVALGFGPGLTIEAALFGAHGSCLGC